jgi:NAD(P)-dependent dehydrogenase (short-subunit alcohol dehydrogenase family)
MMKQRQQTVLITGASSGMGRATALYLAERGYLVYAASRTPYKLENLSANIFPILMDITDMQSVTEALETIEQIDILINNAGYGLVATVEEVTEEQMLSQFDVNVFGVMRMCKAVIPKMRAQGSGVIINISSFLGKIGLPLLTFYNASKYAVEGITDSLRYEVRDFGIRVHSIMPGFFDTSFARENLVTNEMTFSEDSPYEAMVSKLAPTIVEQINGGNDASEVAAMIHAIIEDDNAPARQTAGDKAKKFIPMRRELSDEDFERRVRTYYGLG